MKKINIGENSKVSIEWKVLPFNYSREEENNIAVRFANKYGISKDNVKVEPNFIVLNEKGEKTAITNETIKNIQDPKFQQELFKKYIKEKNIEGANIAEIINIDNQINSLIDYTLYDKQRRYEIKWIKWSNFMSYGPNNYFDFTKLNGLVLLNGVPQNQTGKSTFCNDLIKFLLFGKVSSRNNDWTLSEVFNYYLPEATEVYVEGCLCIEGDDYIIKRVVTRPELKRRSEKSKVQQKVYYYKLVNNEKVELTDIDSQEGENAKKTNQIIKESIGNDKDFDLVICANADNLKSLISLKDTERGRLLSRWIGLLPIEEKDKISREKYNKEVLPNLILNHYNKEQLIVDNVNLNNINEDNKNKLSLLLKNKDDTIQKIEAFEKEKETLFSNKKNIDKSLLAIDVQTIETALKDIEEKGKRKKAEKQINEETLSKLKDITFSEAEYKKNLSKDKNLEINLNSKREECKRLKGEISSLEKSEFCPTCGAKLKNVDNSKAIKEKKELYTQAVNDGIKINDELKNIKKIIEDLEKKREKYNEKVKLELIIDTNTADIENLKNKYRDNLNKLKSLNDNKEAIEINNKIDLQLNIINNNLKTENQYKDSLVQKIEQTKKDIESNNDLIKKNTELINRIANEEELVKNWKLYLELIGKNGISKMVLRNTLPLINGELKRLLNDVCDFEVNIDIDSHNDVSFSLIRNGVVSPLGCGSGFEQTCAGLALRIVLGNISILPRPSFILFDEILGGVSEENYDKVKLLYDRIVKDYSFIFQITHLKSIIDWHDKIINISKTENISTISIDLNKK